MLGFSIFAFLIPSSPVSASTTSNPLLLRLIFKKPLILFSSSTNNIFPFIKKPFLFINYKFTPYLNSILIQIKFKYVTKRLLKKVGWFLKYFKNHPTFFNEYLNYSLLVIHYLRALIEFSTAINVTPTSANTAAHILANPNAPKESTTNLIPKENIIFSQTIFLVLLAISIPFIILKGLSCIITISDASIAASEPNPPIAIPMSALAKTGASFTPSPTKTNLPLGLFCENNFSNSSILFSGSKSV
ncbi:NAD-dependent DNA ligase [Clostridium tetani E88]|uniref:NAD-dependent DNA ligase n=1 Tax=Clostridium tetani (strain Massachusetts / E88) TaxID=212717 RepID=Q892Y0_CLOTE|nr:NAD-dependent DNA ligase [Clostridium tetani E88]